MQIRGSFPHSGAGRILSLQKKIQKSFERKQSRMDQNRMPLVEALQQFREEAPAYFRIPGHRFERGLDETLNGASLAAYDLSEAEGLDDLHHAEGVIAEAQKLAAETWKAKKTFFLVNGTTCVAGACARAVPQNGAYRQPESFKSASAAAFKRISSCFRPR